MRIYIKCSQETEAYRRLIMDALQAAGHEVRYHAQVRNDAAGKEACDLYLEMSAGGQQQSQVKPQSEPSPIPAVSRIDSRIQKLVLLMGKEVLPRRAIVDGLHLRQKSRAVFINNYLKPAVVQGLVTMTTPGHPNLPQQTYRLTAKGLDLYAELTMGPQ